MQSRNAKEYYIHDVVKKLGGDYYALLSMVEIVKAITDPSKAREEAEEKAKKHLEIVVNFSPKNLSFIKGGIRKTYHIAWDLLEHIQFIDSKVLEEFIKKIQDNGEEYVNFFESLLAESKIVHEIAMEEIAFLDYINSDFKNAVNALASEVSATYKKSENNESSRKKELDNTNAELNSIVKTLSEKSNLSYKKCYEELYVILNDRIIPILEKSDGAKADKLKSLIQSKEKSKNNNSENKIKDYEDVFMNLYDAVIYKQINLEEEQGKIKSNAFLLISDIAEKSNALNDILNKINKDYNQLNKEINQAVNKQKNKDKNITEFKGADESIVKSKEILDKCNAEIKKLSDPKEKSIDSDLPGIDDVIKFYEILRGELISLIDSSSQAIQDKMQADDFKAMSSSIRELISNENIIRIKNITKIFSAQIDKIKKSSNNSSDNNFSIIRNTLSDIIYHFNCIIRTVDQQYSKTYNPREIFENRRKLVEASSKVEKAIKDIKIGSDDEELLFSEITNNIKILLSVLGIKFNRVIDQLEKLDHMGKAKIPSALIPPACLNQNKNSNSKKIKKSESTLTDLKTKNNSYADADKESRIIGIISAMFIDEYDDYSFDKGSVIASAKKCIDKSTLELENLVRSVKDVEKVTQHLSLLTKMSKHVEDYDKVYNFCEKLKGYLNSIESNNKHKNKTISEKVDEKTIKAASFTNYKNELQKYRDMEISNVISQLKNKKDEIFYELRKICITLKKEKQSDNDTDIQSKSISNIKNANDRKKIEKIVCALEVIVYNFVFGELVGNPKYKAENNEIYKPLLSLIDYDHERTLINYCIRLGNALLAQMENRDGDDFNNNKKDIIIKMAALRYETIVGEVLKKLTAPVRNALARLLGPSLGPGIIDRISKVRDSIYHHNMETFIGYQETEKALYGVDVINLNNNDNGEILNYLQMIINGVSHYYELRHNNPMDNRDGNFRIVKHMAYELAFILALQTSNFLRQNDNFYLLAKNFKVSDNMNLLYCLDKVITERGKYAHNILLSDLYTITTQIDTPSYPHKALPSDSRWKFIKNEMLPVLKIAFFYILFINQQRNGNFNSHYEISNDEIKLTIKNNLSILGKIFNGKDENEIAHKFNKCLRRIRENNTDFKEYLESQEGENIRLDIEASLLSDDSISVGGSSYKSSHTASPSLISPSGSYKTASPSLISPSGSYNLSDDEQKEIVEKFSASPVVNRKPNAFFLLSKSGELHNDEKNKCEREIGKASISPSVIRKRHGHAFSRRSKSSELDGVEKNKTLEQQQKIVVETGKTPASPSLSRGKNFTLFPCYLNYSKNDNLINQNKNGKIDESIETGVDQPKPLGG